jgi:hypothetical protein
MVRFAFWRRDVDAARALRDQVVEEIPAASPHRIATDAVLRALLDGTTDYLVYPMFPPGAPIAQEIRNFIDLTTAEMGIVVGDRARAMEALLHADSDGLTHLAWLDGCPLFESLRGDPTFAAIRERVAQRAARVVAEHAAPLTGH